MWKKASDAFFSLQVNNRSNKSWEVEFVTTISKSLAPPPNIDHPFCIKPLSKKNSSDPYPLLENCWNVFTPPPCREGNRNYEECGDPVTHFEPCAPRRLTRLYVQNSSSIFSHIIPHFKVFNMIIIIHHGLLKLIK